MADRMLDKLAKLLNQAENAGTEAEAEVFLKKAQQLATTESIDLAVARQHTAKRERREQPIQKSVKIGDSGKKGLSFFVDLFLEVSRNNDVRANIAHDSSYVYLFGMPSDIEVTEALYGSLVFQMVEAANKWLKTGEYKEQIVGKYVRRKFDDGYGGHYWDEVWVEKPLDGRVARANFYDGFRKRIAMRLWEAKNAAMEAVKERTYQVMDEAGNEVQRTAELVLVTKREEVADFYKSNSRAKGHWRGSSVSTYSSDGQTAGNRAGGSARMGSAKAIANRTAIR